MELATYIRRPFTIEAVEVTTENIEEIASLCGELRETAKGVPFIAVDRTIVPHITRVYPGYYFTRTGGENGKIRCYTKRVFQEQYLAMDAEADASMRPYFRTPRQSKQGGKKANVFTDPPTPAADEAKAREAEMKEEMERAIPRGGTYDPNTGGEVNPS